jgi:hypothetical protein
LTSNYLEEWAKRLGVGDELQRVKDIAEVIEP